MDFPIILNQQLFPVQAFFNAMPARSLIGTLRAFCSGVGAGFNDATCEFPEELDEDESCFEGVRFEIFNESAIVSNSEFFDIVSKVCDSYLDGHPDERDTVRELMERLAVRFREGLQNPIADWRVK